MDCLIISFFFSFTDGLDPKLNHKLARALEEAKSKNVPNSTVNETLRKLVLLGANCFKILQSNALFSFFQLVKNKTLHIKLDVVKIGGWKTKVE